MVPYEEDAMSMSGLKGEQMALHGVGEHQAFLLTIPLQKYNGAFKGGG